MKLTTATIGAAASTPVLAWAWAFAQAGGDTPTGIIQGLSTLGAAGLVWWLLAVRDPRRDADALRLQKDHDQRIDKLYKEHSKELREIMDVVAALKAALESHQPKE